MAGNSVILKPSAQTPLCGEHFALAFKEAGLPDSVLQCLFLNHDSTTKIINESKTNFTCFTGSVSAGKKIEIAASGTFIGTGLELGGKDPAYVRPDVNFDNCVTELVDGAFFNSGQSCCGIERIYVHSSLHSKFVDAFVEKVRQLKLDDPCLADTTLGPVVKNSAANWVRNQIREAKQKGASACIDSSKYTKDTGDSPYLAPQVLINVDHSMSMMREESFGPIVGIMSVSDDQKAITLMNDSDLGLTASIWTQDQEAAETLGNQIETGTVFMNHCDYLDPALAWTGVKNTGHGVTLSRLGYLQLSQPKSFNLKNI
jgi:acyl-CoA reductase-like NAD-dependent aldehyde dehydrogenase